MHVINVHNHVCAWPHMPPPRVTDCKGAAWRKLDASEARCGLRHLRHHAAERSSAYEAARAMIEERGGKAKRAPQAQMKLCNAKNMYKIPMELGIDY